jgi:hypothetical protein
MNFVSKLIQKLTKHITQANTSQLPHCPTQWIDAQKYELNNAIQFMNLKIFNSVIDNLNDPNNLISKGYVDQLTLKEYFGNNINQYHFAPELNNIRLNHAN